jgi:hypothetical protein
MAGDPITTAAYKALDKDFEPPVTVVLPTFSAPRLGTRLGELTQGRDESFLPFIVERVIPSNEERSPSSFDLMHIVIDRADVEAGDIQPVLHVLNTLVTDRATIREHEGRVIVSFHGYDSDPRAIQFIPEIRRFLELLTQAFPYWLHFLPKQGPLLETLMFCLVPVRPAGAGRTRFDLAALSNLLLYQFGHINRLYEEHDIPDSNNERLTLQVEAYLLGEHGPVQRDHTRILSDEIYIP